MKSFDVLSPSLDPSCSRLIEASAGTGKTFALEHLTLRWLLSTQEALLDQVALITFTRKSAQDLRERLRQRFEKAYQELREGNFETPYLASLEEEKRPLVLLKLIESLMNFDLMPISTIHAFAAKLLNRSGWLLETETGLEKEYLHQLIQLHLESLHLENKKALSKEDSLVLRLVEHMGWDLDLLTKELASALSCGLEIGSVADGSSDIWEEFFEKDQKLPSYELLLDLAEDFKESFRTDGQIRLDLKKQLEHWKRCLEGNRIFDHDRLIEILEHFSKDNLKKKASEEAKALCLWVETKAQALDQLEFLSLKKRGLEILARRLKKALSPLFKRDMRLGHDVILKKLEEAIDSPLGPSLARSLKLLIVDEFQDTDPTQWRLFQKLTQLNPSLQLILVGDPKQSIYGFRQADIYTYLEAKEYVKNKLQGSIDQLNTNYRSHPKLVEALNQLFACKKAGQWLQLPRAKGFLECPLVLPGRKEPIEEVEPRLHFHDLDSHKGLDTLEAASYWVGAEYQRLKSLGFESFAILVSQHKTGRKLQKLLDSQGIRVRIQKPLPFAHLPCFGLFRLILEAFEKPYFGDRMRKLWSHPIWQLSFEEIEGLLGLESQQVLEFQDPWAQFWQSLTHLHYLLIEKGLGAFWQHFWNLKFPNVEVSLYQKIHSTEAGIDIYQQMNALWMWLEEEISHVFATEALKLLDVLESREKEESALYHAPTLKGAIDILTVHASKGLEYQVVFCLSSLAKKRPGFQRWMQVYDQNEPRLVSSGASHPRYLEACDEIDAEKARQLYVAWTRSREHLLIGYQSKKRAKPRRSQASPLELFRASWQCPEDSSITNWYESFEQLPYKFEEHLLELSRKKTVALSSSFTLPKERASMKALTSEFVSQVIQYKELVKSGAQNYWQRSSFSHLVRHSHDLAQSLFQDGICQVKDVDDLEPSVDQMGKVPRGTEIGVLWHLMFQRALQMLEQARALEFIESYLTSEAFLKSAQFLSLEKFHVAAMAQQVVKLLDNSWKLKLDNQTLSLRFSDLPKGCIWTEKKFEMSKSRVKEVLADQVQFGVDPIQLSGVIDAIIALPQGLVFIDWKSNWIGPNQSYYQEESLRQNALDHRYDLQALIYQFAIETSLVREKKGPVLGGVYFYIRGTYPLIWSAQERSFSAHYKTEGAR